MTSRKAHQREADRMRRLIKNTPFAQCLPIVPRYSNLSFQCGIYAIKSAQGVVLYIGKASSFRTRFQSGHQALLAILIDGYQAQDVRIVLVPTTEGFVEELLDLERFLIVVFDPAYNIRKPDPIKVMMMVTTKAPVAPGRIKELLQTLPEIVLEQLESHADTYGVAQEQVVERAITFFLDPDAVVFSDLEPERFKGLGVLMEENTALTYQNQSLNAKAESLTEEIARLKAKLQTLGITDA
jgi:hypothetical protein